MIGGLLADRVDRRRLLVSMQILQGALSFGLAVVAWTSHPSHVLIVGASCSRSASPTRSARPGLSAILPTLVPPRRPHRRGRAHVGADEPLARDRPGDRRAHLSSRSKPGPVFAINAVTYVFAVIGLVWARYPRYAAAPESPRAVEHRLLSGVRIARADPVIRYVLLTLFTFSFFSVTFVGIMPLVARVQPRHQVDERCRTACCTRPSGSAPRSGAFTVGIGASRNGRRSRCCGPGFIAFAIALAAFGLVRNVPGAFVGRGRARLHVLPRHHVPVDDPPEAAARRTTRTGHGAVDHGLRRHGAARASWSRARSPSRTRPRCCSSGQSGRWCSRVFSSARSLREKGAPDD